MKRLNLILIFLFFLILSLGATMPASFVLEQIKLDKNLKYGSVTGYWWAFNVDWLSYKDFLQEDTQIVLKLSCLMSASICLELDNDQGHIKVGKSLFNDDVFLEQSNYKVDFSELNSFYKNLLVKPSGVIEFKIDSLMLNKNQLLGLSGDIYWHNVGVEGESFDLGSVQARVSHQAKQIKLKLLDQSEKLDLSGDVKFRSNGLIESDIQLKTLDGFPASVKTVVESIMRKRGRDMFSYNAKVSNPSIKRLKVSF